MLVSPDNVLLFLGPLFSLIEHGRNRTDASILCFRWPLLTPAEGYASCAPVSAGYYWSSNASQLPCPKGYTSPRGEVGCDECAAGTYSDTLGAPTCSVCANGTASAKGAETCTECVEGEYAHGGASCSPCPLGHYSDKKMVGECTPCPVGTYAGSEGQTACDTLPAGYASAEEGVGNLSLVKCDSGYYAPSEQATACTQAAPGYYVPAGEAGATAQTQCRKGTSASGWGWAACAPCEPGTVAAGKGATACAACAGCTFAPEWGGSICADAPGGALPNANKSSVLDCGLGKYRHANDTTCGCTQCHTNHYNDQERADVCVECPKGMFTAGQGAWSASNCVETTFGDDDYYGLAVASACDHPGGCYYGVPVLASSTALVGLSFVGCCCLCACAQHRRTIKARKKARRKERRAAREAAAQGSKQFGGANPMGDKPEYDEEEDDDSDDSDDSEDDGAPITLTQVKLRAGKHASAARPPPPQDDDGGGAPSPANRGSNPMHGGRKASPKKTKKKEKGGKPFAPLPAGWEEHEDEATGRSYFYNEATQVTTWKRPTGSLSEMEEEPIDRADSLAFREGAGANAL